MMARATKSSSASSSTSSLLCGNTPSWNALSSSLASFASGIDTQARDVRSLVETSSSSSFPTLSSSDRRKHEGIAQKFVKEELQRRVDDLEENLLSIADETLGGLSEGGVVGLDDSEMFDIFQTPARQTSEDSNGGGRLREILPTPDMARLCGSLHSWNGLMLQHLERHLVQYGYEPFTQEDQERDSLHDEELLTHGIMEATINPGVHNESTHTDSVSNALSDTSFVGMPLERVSEGKEGEEDASPATVTTTVSSSSLNALSPRIDFESPEISSNAPVMSHTPATPCTPTLASLNLTAYGEALIHNDEDLATPNANDSPEAIASPDEATTGKEEGITDYYNVEDNQPSSLSTTDRKPALHSPFENIDCELSVSIADESAAIDSTEIVLDDDGDDSRSTLSVRERRFHTVKNPSSPQEDSDFHNLSSAEEVKTATQDDEVRFSLHPESSDCDEKGESVHQGQDTDSPSFHCGESNKGGGRESSAAEEEPSVLASSSTGMPVDQDDSEKYHQLNESASVSKKEPSNNLRLHGCNKSADKGEKSSKDGQDAPAVGGSPPSMMEERHANSVTQRKTEFAAEDGSPVKDGECDDPSMAESDFEENEEEDEDEDDEEKESVASTVVAAYSLRRKANASLGFSALTSNRAAPLEVSNQVGGGSSLGGGQEGGESGTPPRKYYDSASFTTASIICGNRDHGGEVGSPSSSSFSSIVMSPLSHGFTPDNVSTQGVIRSGISGAGSFLGGNNGGKRRSPLARTPLASAWIAKHMNIDILADDIGMAASAKGERCNPTSTTSTAMETLQEAPADGRSSKMTDIRGIDYDSSFSKEKGVTSRKSGDATSSECKPDATVDDAISKSSSSCSLPSSTCMIREVTQTEYDAAPRVVKMQVSVKDVNSAVRMLNTWWLGQQESDCGNDTQRGTEVGARVINGGKVAERRLQLTEEEAYDILKKSFGERRSKSILMSLCHWRRMIIEMVSNKNTGGAGGKVFVVYE